MNLEQSLDCFILTVRLSAPQVSCLGPSNLLEGADWLGYHWAQGLAMVAEGAADPIVRLSLQRAVQAVTGVPLSSIEVFEMDYLT